MKTKLDNFFTKIKLKQIDLYNEFGLQFELALYLRRLSELADFKIELERPISHFSINKSKDIPKKEIDVCVYDTKKNEKYAIEIKFPTNGQTPLQMFEFCKDISFLEKLKNNGFKSCYSLVIVNHDDSYREKKKNDGVYSFFRNGVTINGDVECPTGKNKFEKINIEKQYNPKWEKLFDDYYYYLLEI